MTTDITPSNIHYDYSGAAVLVTGGTSGIGAAIAEAFQASGAEVTITGTRSTASDYELDLSKYQYLQLDVENTESIDSVANALPRLDILVNNGGVALPSLGLDESDPDVFQRAVQMHLVSAHRMAERCKDKLAKSALPGGASVIGIASMSSFFGMEIVPGYGSAKTGLVGMTRALAVAWGKHNIRVNAVAAGLTASRMTAATVANAEWSAPTLARTPAGRLGEPTDIAAPVLFLSSAGASWITGQTLAVDGGYTISG
ncbi:SDR family oxidoreductase [Parahaliea sp. F7430]|uniref:SDR family oxidoreductase n=1 Tax=Sediminihaliea albiluteola TaxID=2758564 RepID=A0A7W2TWU3_9GAMM|nr:SDR family oxidoreductase [Sediminihaliea albiluteola]MBA6413387.1 SDR family oxidoreductase [Sediminihaliea albiluteola]